MQVTGNKVLTNAACMAPWPNNCAFSGTKFGTDHLTNKSGYWANADHAPFDKAVDTK